MVADDMAGEEGKAVKIVRVAVAEQDTWVYRVEMRMKMRV